MNKNRIHSVYLRCLQRQQRQEVDTNKGATLVEHTVYRGGLVYEGGNLRFTQGTEWRVILTKSLSVMPGDRVSVTAYAKYMNLSGDGNPNAFAAALTAAFGVSSGSTGEQFKLYNNLNTYGLSMAGGEHPGDDDTAPKAFVTILLFDRDYNLLDAAWDQITTDLEQVSATAKEPFDYPLSKEVTVQEAGYASIFLSNEHPTYVDVYFDDMVVSHTSSPIVSTSDYFPFGLSFNDGDKEGNVEQMFTFNSKEKQTELDLGWLDYGARMYMPDIGRWGVNDPLAEITPGISSNAYCYNSPVNFVDPTGMRATPKKDAYGRSMESNFTGQYIAPMDRENVSQELSNSQDLSSNRNDPPRDGRRREITENDIAASYRLQEYGTDIYSQGKLISHTPEGYYLIPVDAEQGDPQTWYYMSREGTPHGMVYDPVGGFIYEINGVPRQSVLEQIEGLIINSVPSNNVKVNISVAYQYKDGSPGWDKLWAREKEMGSVFLLSPVTVSNPAAATAWFQGQTGNSWNYSIGASNCAHYSVQGLNAGGAGINFSGPFPSSFPIAPTMTWTAGQSYPVPIK